MFASIYKWPHRQGGCLVYVRLLHGAIPSCTHLYCASQDVLSKEVISTVSSASA